jgi:ABC-type Mn2+/Zn2+ transport system ATPase subunit
MLDLRLTSSLGDRRWDINTQLAPGVCHWLQGPNGCGKTTFFEQLKLHWSSPLDLAFTDQAPLDSYQDLTVAQLFNVLVDAAAARVLSADWQGLSIWDARSRQLTPRLVWQLSGGEKQWIKILMMRTLRAQVWLLDEPFHGLDQDRQEELIQLITDWLSNGNYLLLTHHGTLPLRTAKVWRLVGEVSVRMEAV